MSESSTTPEGGANLDRPLLRGTARRALLKLERIVVGFEATLGVLLVSSMAVLLVVQVFSRFVMSLPIFWVEEVARLTMIWIVFIGVAYAISTNTHLTVTAVTDRFPRVVRIWLERVVLLLVAYTCIEVSVAGLDLAQRFSSISASSSGLSRSWYFVPTALGFALASVQASIVIVTRPLIGPAEDPDIDLGEEPGEALP